jgi:CRP-like cAMP-binding protein
VISKSEPAAALAAAPLFSGLPPDTVFSISRELRRIELAPGELLWQQGDAADGFHLVESGTLAVTARAPGEREIELVELGPGDILGELPLLAGGERSASVRAVESASVLVLDGARFRTLLAALDPDAEALRRRLLNIVCERLRARHARLAAMLGESPPPAAAGDFLRASAPVPPHSYLARLALFRDFNAQALDELLAVTDVVDVGRGVEVCAEGERPDFCAVTLNGALEELVQRGDRGVRVRLAGPGLATCYVGLLDGLPSSVGVSARERARLALLPRPAFDDLVAGRTPAGRSFLEALQRDLVGALRLAQRPQARLSFG